MKLLSLLIILTILQINLFAQVGINTDNTDPDPSAMLDIKSTNKSMLIPRMTSTQRTAISGAALGLLVFDTDTESFWFKETTAWVELVSGNTGELVDEDGDTKIQVEESVDEDVIRFDMAGTEFFRMDSGRLEVLNTGSSIFIGKDAGLNDDLTENNNVFIGSRTGKENISGRLNIAIGSDALSRNTASRNIAIGAASLTDNVTGENNTAFGEGAGTYNKGSRNVFLGNLAGSSLLDKNTDNSVMIGFQSGLGATGDGNIFIGYYSGLDATGGNKLYIENSASYTPLIYGEFDNDLLRINGTLNINSAFSFPTSDGTDGQVLETNGSGALTWTDKTTSAILLEDTDADTKIQIEESADEDIIRFDLGGTEYFRMDKATLEVNNSGNSVFIGQDAAKNDDLTNNKNVAIGHQSMQSQVDGYHNVAIGFQAMKDRVSGHSNTAIGERSLHENISGIYNTCLGSHAGRVTTANSNTYIGALVADVDVTGYQNTVVGTYAMMGTTSANRNVIMGTEAMRYNDVGSQNVVIGHNTGRNMTGNRNVIIGGNAGRDATTTNSVFIGYQAGYNEINNQRLYIENSNSTSPLISAILGLEKF